MSLVINFSIDKWTESRLSIIRLLSESDVPNMSKITIRSSFKSLITITCSEELTFI